MISDQSSPSPLSGNLNLDISYNHPSLFVYMFTFSVPKT